MLLTVSVLQKTALLHNHRLFWVYNLACFVFASCKVWPTEAQPTWLPAILWSYGGVCLWLHLLGKMWLRFCTQWYKFNSLYRIWELESHLVCLPW